MKQQKEQLEENYGRMVLAVNKRDQKFTMNFLGTDEPKVYEIGYPLGHYENNVHKEEDLIVVPQCLRRIHRVGYAITSDPLIQIDNIRDIINSKECPMSVKVMLGIVQQSSL